MLTRVYGCPVKFLHLPTTCLSMHMYSQPQNIKRDGCEILLCKGKIKLGCISKLGFYNTNNGTLMTRTGLVKKKKGHKKKQWAVTLPFCSRTSLSCDVDFEGVCLGLVNHSPAKVDYIVI